MNAKILVIGSIFCSLCLCVPGEAAGAKIIKVLPHLLDAEGRYSLFPSLFERDAYQALLRENPSMQSAIRFDIQWKMKGVQSSHVRIRLELHMSKNESAKPHVLELLAKRPRWFSKWSSIKLEESDFRKMGNLISWRATLWDGDRQLAELKSFLW